MADYARIVDEIRLFLQSSDRTLRRDSAELAIAYAEACAEANERLKRSAKFLQQGLRSEAIHLAEAEPNLLDLVATLDFPERAEWEQMAFTYEWPKPQALLIDAAEALNEAYAQERPLQVLLRQHRLLALARAPLADRIRILRKITDLDAANPIWAQDLRTYELVRIQQLIEETNHAAEKHDVAALSRIVEEVESFDWLEHPPETLVKLASQESQNCKREIARQSLKLTGEKLLAAFSALDVARARQQRDLWRVQAKDAGLPAIHAIRDRVKPALDWLSNQDLHDQEQQEYEESVAALEAALDADADRVQLERLARAVLKDGREMSPELRSQYRKRLTLLDDRTRRRRKLIVRSLAAAALVAGILSMLWAHEQLQASKAAKVATAVEGMLAASQLDQARTVLDSLAVNEPAVASMPEVVDVRRRLETLQAQEATRQAELQQALREAEAAPIDQDDPAPLKKARSLATLADEKAMIARQTQTRHDAYLKEQGRREDAFRKRVFDLEPKVEKLEGLAQIDVGSEATGTVLKQVQAELDDLLAREAPRLSKEVATLAEPLARKVGLVARSRVAHAKREQIEIEITRSFATPPTAHDDLVDQYVAALGLYLQAFPDDTHSKAFRKVIAEQPLWKAAVAWEQMTEPWMLGRMTITDTAEARTRLDQCRQFLADHPDFADASLVRTYIGYLDAIVKRESSSEAGLRDQLVKLFAGRLIENLWQVRAKGGKAYYVSDEPKLNEALRLRYVAGFREEKAQIFINHSDVEQIVRAPQSRIADFAKDKLSSMTVSTWDATMVSILRRIQDDRDLDPLLKVSLLMKVLGIAQQGSYPLERAVQPYNEALRRGSLAVNVPWMDPESAQAIRLRPLAAQVIKSLPTLTQAVESASQYRTRLEAQVAQRTHWVGWLVKQESGSWRCRLGVEPAGDVKL
ncbi:MAG TPA: hypothetical protein VGZ22_23650, partial [Isosphaeraceae bacterium]|nr:hypothetical protein [Isosphaeraceae bacterium]